jgi:hypothetical protein
MKNIYKTILKVGIAALLIVSLLPSCGQSEKNQGPQQQSSTEEQKYEKAPQKLDSIESNIEKIFKALDGPTVNTEVKKGQGGGQNESSQESKTSQQSQSSQPQQQSSQAGAQGGSSQPSQGGQKGQQKQQGATQPPAPKDPWKDIDGIIYNLHYQWNDYMPEVVKKGTDRKIPDNFSIALNKLTDVVKTKDKVKALNATNNLYSCVPDLYSLYRTKMSPEIKRMRHLIRSSILASTENNWPQADKDLVGLKTSWSMFKTTLDKDQHENSDRMDLSIYELEKVIGEKNFALSDIKGRVALSNVEAIEKTFKEKENK